LTKFSSLAVGVKLSLYVSDQESVLHQKGLRINWWTECHSKVLALLKACQS